MLKNYFLLIYCPWIGVVMHMMRVPKLIIAAVILVTIMFINCAMADIIQIPFSVYPRELQKKFAKVGKQLDLSADNRSKKSWAFIRNNGTNYDIVTYAPTNVAELELIQKIVTEN